MKMRGFELLSLNGSKYDRKGKSEQLHDVSYSR